jgi:hypothetical protein
MTNFLTSVAALLALGVSFWGWGRVAARILYGSNSVGWFYPAALGLAVVTVLGGFGNSLEVASPGFLWAIIAIGCTFAAEAIRHIRFNREALLWLIMLGGAGLAALGFLASTLMPAGVFNHFDDFHTYIVRPIRMVQTGSLAGGWFDLLGWDALGAQSFFQGFLLLVFPPAYLNGFDAVFCAALAIALSGELSRRLGAPLVVAATAMTVLVAINPQTVNLSSLYSGTVAVQGLLLATLLWNEALAAETRQVPWRPAIAIGFFLALLIGLKATLAVFSAIFSVLWLMCALIFYRGRRAVILSGLGALLTTVLAVSPWLVLHRDNLLTALARLLGGQFSDSGDSGPAPKGVRAYYEFWNLDSTYGGKFIDYTLLAAGLLVAGVVTLAVLWRHRDSENHAYLISVSAASIAAVLIFLGHPYLTDAETAIRYAIPVFLAVAPFVVTVSGRFRLVTPMVHGARPAMTAHSMLVSVLFLLAAVVMFGDVMQRRVNNLLEKRTSVSYPVGKELGEYSRYALSSLARDNVMHAQRVTEPGAGILVAISQPFQMDFARNRVMVATEPALLVPWLDLPLDAGVDVFRHYLLDRGVRYVVRERTGTGIVPLHRFKRFLVHPHPLYRRLGRQALRFHSALDRLAAESVVVFADDQLTTMDLMKSLSKPHRPTRALSKPRNDHKS